VALVVCIAFAGCTNGYSPVSKAAPVVNEDLGGNPLLGWWNMPQAQPWDLLEELQAKLTPLDLSSLAQEPYRNATWGQTSAEEAAHILYNATRIPGVFELVPKQFRGVFWFKGDGTGETLVSLQYGQWFADDLVYVQPISPFVWAYANGVPKGASGLQQMEIAGAEGSNFTVQTATGQPGNSFTYSFSEASMKHGLIQSHKDGNLSMADTNGGAINSDIQDFGIPIPDDTVTGRFTLEELEGVKPGSLYKRGCYWGVGYCDCFEFGSYHLVKVIDKDGSPLEPYYSEMIDFVGDTPVYMWSGFASQESQQEAAQYYEDLLAA